MHPRTLTGSALELPFPDESFDAIVTSPTYGNRLADHHDARDGSYRRSYRHCLGRPLHEGNAGAFQWGSAYREFHERAWTEALRVLRPEGTFVLNVSNHIRKGVERLVSEWHLTTLLNRGLRFVASEQIATPRYRYGSNRQRVQCEHVFWLHKP
jgi:ubiquinone/menaquinone biosynthesis C-methylase UbiE